MNQTINTTKRMILSNLFLFNTLYIALILADRQLLRRGYLGFQLPFKIGVMGSLAGLVLGSVIVTGVSLLIKKRTWILRLVFLSSLVLISLFLNYFLFQFYYPPFTITQPGDLQTLGENNWHHDYPYSVLTSIYEKYYLQTVFINPTIANYDELSRVKQFGIILNVSLEVPTSLNDNQLAKLTDSLEENFEQISENGFEYRLYDVKPDQDLLLTSSENLILFVPKELFTE